MASGADDGAFKIWDLRNFKADYTVARFAWHTSPISSLEWHPTQGSVIAVSADNQLTLWDLALERDEDEEAALRAQGGEVPDIPPQLLFVHMGQQDMKELHFHSQLPGVIGCSAADGFNIFQTINSE
mmetsp:Transcript_30595/g.71870  ORF Transcript_30595/g.71870 Transcript_30595/m.71870 type:complete len:127 (-) Transcript_30595:22-402(-)